jgi:hypothetical protein
MVGDGCVHVKTWYAAGVTALCHGASVTALIYGLELMRLVRGWCDSAKSLHMVSVDFMFVFVRSPPQSTYFLTDETGLVCLPTQLERTLQLYW